MGIPILSALRTISLIGGVYVAVLFVGGVVPLGYFFSVGLINFAVLLTLVRIVNKGHRLATSAIPICIGGAIGILALLRCQFDSLVFANFVPDSVKIGYLDCSISAFPSIGGMLSGLLVCWIIWNCGRQSKLHVSYALVLLLSFELIYGIYAFQKGGLSVIGLGVRASDTFLTGTFGNRGLYSAFVAMISPIALSICLYDKKIPMFFRISVLSMLVILIGVALTLSASRLGYLALLTGILGWAVSTVFVKKNELNNRGLILTSMVFVSIVSTSIWFGADKLVERYFELILSPIRRLDIWMATFDLPWTAWLFGIGVGRFEHVYPIVQPALTQRTFYYLHNDLLQFLLEFGAICSALVFLVSFLIVRRLCVVKMNYIGCGAMGGICAGVVFVAADFPLRIPGTGFIFCCLIGLLFTTNAKEHSSTDSKEMARISDT